jgi:hypothetical protein
MGVGGDSKLFLASLKGQLGYAIGADRVVITNASGVDRTEARTPR